MEETTHQIHSRLQNLLLSTVMAGNPGQDAIFGYKGNIQETIFSSVLSTNHNDFGHGAEMAVDGKMLAVNILLSLHYKAAVRVSSLSIATKSEY